MNTETKFLDFAGLQYYTSCIKTLLEEKLTLDYSVLAFDTSEIVIDSTAEPETVAMLGKAILGKMRLM